VSRDHGVQDDQNEQRDHEEHHDRRHDEARHPPFRSRCYARRDVRAIVVLLDLVGHHQEYRTVLEDRDRLLPRLCALCVQRSFRYIIAMLRECSLLCNVKLL